MTAVDMEILGLVGEKRPNLGLERAGSADALATYAKARWRDARSIRKAVANEWSLTADEARSVLEGTASKATYDKIKRHPNGGWRVVVEVEAAVIGQSLDQFLETESRRRARDGERYLADSRHLLEVARDLPAVIGLGRRRDR